MSETGEKEADPLEGVALPGKLIERRTYERRNELRKRGVFPDDFEVEDVVEVLMLGGEGHAVSKIAAKVGMTRHEVVRIFAENVELVKGRREAEAFLALETQRMTRDVLDAKLEQLRDDPALMEEVKVGDLAKTWQVMGFAEGSIEEKKKGSGEAGAIEIGVAREFMTEFLAAKKREWEAGGGSRPASGKVVDVGSDKEGS